MFTSPDKAEETVRLIAGRDDLVGADGTHCYTNRQVVGVRVCFSSAEDFDGSGTSAFSSEWVDRPETQEASVADLVFRHGPFCETKSFHAESYGRFMTGRPGEAGVSPHGPIETTHSGLFVDMLRIGLSVCFLATGGDKLVNPDVFNADFRSYLDAVNRRDDRAVVAMIARATASRHGRPGYTVGREEALLGRRNEAFRADEEIGEGSGRELKHQHQRKGHFHKFWSGPGRDTLTIRFVRQHTVRPDLPLPDEMRVGSKTLPSKQAEDEILRGG